MRALLFGPFCRPQRGTSLTNPQNLFERGSEIYQDSTLFCCNRTMKRYRILSPWPRRATKGTSNCMGFNRLLAVRTSGLGKGWCTDAKNQMD